MQPVFNPATRGMARNRPGISQTNPQNMHASKTVVAFNCIGRPMTTGTIKYPSNVMMNT